MEKFLMAATTQGDAGDRKPREHQRVGLGFGDRNDYVIHRRREQVQIELGWQGASVGPRQGKRRRRKRPKSVKESSALRVVDISPSLPIARNVDER